MKTASGTPLVSRVVLGILDGLRPDAIAVAPMPVLARLAHDGWSCTATTVRPSITVAALTSLATGISPAAHSLTQPRVPPLGVLSRLRPLPAELRRQRRRTLVVTGQLPQKGRLLARGLLGLAGVERFASGGESPAEIAEHASQTLARRTAHLCAVYLNHCDLAGHAHGWMSAPYLAAAAALDQAVAHLVASLDDGQTLFAFVADHGGGGAEANDHDAPHPVNDAIPLVFFGAGVSGSASGVSLLDVPPTLLHALGVPVPASYEGQVLALSAPPASAAA